MVHLGLGPRPGRREGGEDCHLSLALVVVCSYALAREKSRLAQPLKRNDILYITSQYILTVTSRCCFPDTLLVCAAVSACGRTATNGTACMS